MPTLETIVDAPSELHEALVAEFSEIGFDSFRSEGTALRSYRQHAGDDSKVEIDARVRDVLQRYRVAGRPHHTVHPDRNWNADWEASVRAVSVGRFVIAPDWDLPAEESAGITIRINPKMSFGTGHHESTRLALRLLDHLLAPNDRVLDAGTGTGVLAIAAIKLGAAHAVAIDVDEAVKANFNENSRTNQVAESVTFLSGPVGIAKGREFDLIVANINRAVLLDSLDRFNEILPVGGTLILSGLLRTDQSMMISAASGAGFDPVEQLGEGEWWACGFRKRGNG
ncbi:MAG: 50S ribosomal protein L11 methyltransferase [Rhodothermia bacterium]|nr:50S ribosomal protein L11 methyltransferase [Rhodothermia bacterium]